MKRMPRRSRPAADYLRAAASLVTLVALLVGIPLALHGLWHPVWPPATAPGIWHALTTPDQGNLLIDLLGALGWAAWGSFAIAVIVEFPAQLRRRPAVHLPALGWAQRGAGALVASIFLAVASPALALAATAPAHAATVTVSASAGTTATASSAVHPGSPAHAPDREQSADPDSATTSTASDQTGPTYRVQDGDTFMSIAESQLGSYHQWRELYDLNQGRIMADGQALTNPNQLAAGTVLELPATVSAQNTAPQSATSSTEYEVRSGDSLWSIAQHAYGPGQGKDWTRIYDANTGRPLDHAGDEMTDPADIQPGWNLEIPQAEASATAPTSTAATSRPATAANPTTATPTTSPSTSAATPSTAAPGTGAPASATTSAPAKSASPQPTTAAAGTASRPGSTGAQQPTPAATSTGQATSPAPTVPASSPAGATSSRPVHASSAPTATAHAQHAAPSTDRDLGLAAGALTLISAAALTTTLLARRRLQNHSRRFAERVQAPAPGSPAAAFARRARDAADPAALEHVAGALQLIADDCAHRKTPLPELAAILYHPGDRLEIRLRRGAELPAPFDRVQQIDTWWQIPLADLDQENAGDLHEQAAASSPYPGLVLLGTDPDGASVMIDPESAGTLTITGAQAHTLPVLRRILADLAVTPLAGNLVILLADSGTLTQGNDLGPRVTPYNSLDQAIAAFGEAARAISADLRQNGHAHIRAARPRQEPNAAEATYVLITDQVPSDDQQRALAELVALDPAASVAAILPAPYPMTYLTGWVVDAEADPVHIPETGADITLAGLDGSSHSLLADLLNLSEQIASEPDPAWSALLDGQAPPGADGAHLHTYLASPGPHTPSTIPDIMLPAPGQPPSGELAEPAPDAEFADQSPAPADVENPPDTDQADTAPEAPAEADTPSAQPVLPRIEVLGPVRLTGRTGTVRTDRPRLLTEIAVYIAIHPDTNYQRVRQAIWEGDTSDRTSEISRVRKWLGQDSAGNWFLPVNGSHLTLRATCDWFEFLEHAAAGRYGQALDLVRGRPFIGSLGQKYRWAAEEYEGLMIDKIVDVALKEAQLRLKDGDVLAAHSAINIGASLASEHEETCVMKMRVLQRMGRHDEALNLADRILSTCDVLGLDAEEATVEAIHQCRAIAADAMSVVGTGEQ